jgi:penicillin amidase
MTASSPGAVIWWMFWNWYARTVFQPWWTAAGVPVSLDPAGLAAAPGLRGLDADLATWTVGDQRNAAFSPPLASAAATRRFARLTRSITPAAADMRTAFRRAVTELSEWLGNDLGAWEYGKLHTAQFPSLTGAGALGYGPAAAGGDDSTVNSAVGLLNSEFGQSVRVVAGWPAAGTAVAQVSYPGGQSENPASPWYSDQTSAWWSGGYLSMPPAARTGAPITWELRP